MYVLKGHLMLELFKVSGVHMVRAVAIRITVIYSTNKYKQATKLFSAAYNLARQSPWKEYDFKK